MKQLCVCIAMAAAAPAWAQSAPPPAVTAPQPVKQAVIVNPDWVRLPATDELASYYPHSASEPGNVNLECDVAADGHLTGCVVASEEPANQGFGKAALAMYRLFRMKPETRDGVPVGGGVVTIPLRFSDFGAAQPPTWVHPPTPEEQLSVWPKGAPDSGGEASVECTVTPKGQAKDCSVISETPARSGFGAAAVKLSPRFQLAPAQQGGHAYPLNVQVLLTISFTKPEPKQNGAEDFGGITALHNAPWHAAPTTAEMAAAWPSRAPASLGEAKVRVQCGFSPDTALTGCKLLSEDPPGFGFGAAAVRLTDRFRTRGAIMEDALLAKARIFLSFDFVNPKLAGQAPVWLDQPNWVSFIPADRMTELYPSAAADAGVKTGRGVVVCTVAADGSLTACQLDGEDPAGKGFGQAALAAITSFAVNPWTEDGRPVDGDRIRVPIRFVESEPVPPQEPAEAPAAAGKTSP